MTRDDDYMEYFKRREEKRIQAVNDLANQYPDLKDYILSRISEFAYISGKLIIPDKIKNMIKIKNNGHLDL